MGLKVKACWNCKEYIPLDEGTRRSQILEENFGDKHNTHTIITMEFDEAKEGGYRQSKLVSS